MSTITANGMRVTSASVTTPYYGTWSADIALAEANEIADAIVLVVGDLTLKGTAIRRGSFAGSRTVRLVGGGAGWRKAIPAKGYSHPAGVKLSSVLGDAARESGERIQIATDRTIGTHYSRDAFEAKAERVLKILLDDKWWMDPAGVTQTKDRASDAIVTPFTVISWTASKGQFEIATETIAPWQPGRTFSAPNAPGMHTISSVTIDADNEGKLRLHVLTTDGAVERLRTDMRALIRSELAALSCFGVWEYTIATGDSSRVDVVSSDPRLPDLTRVPMSPGLIGEVVTPTPGSKCRIVFVNGDPTRPECVGIEGSPILISIAGGVLPAAKLGDFAGPFPIAATAIKVLL